MKRLIKKSGTEQWWVWVDKKEQVQISKLKPKPKPKPYDIYSGEGVYGPYNNEAEAQKQSNDIADAISGNEENKSIDKSENNWKNR